MTIDERLANSHFPLPAIREVNMSKHPTGISLGLGELKSFPVDEKILEAMQDSWQQGGSSYSPNAGLPALRKAVADNQRSQDGFSYTEENVVVTIGVQNAVYTSIKTLRKLGASRILIPEIYFGIYMKIPKEFGMEVVTYALTANFGIDLDQLEQQIKPDDIILLNSPSNPTGRLFSETEQQQLGQLLQRKLTDGYVISDEIYGRLVYDGQPSISFSKFFNRTIVVDGISKSGAVAGLRVGWIITQNTVLAQAFISNNATIISAPPTANQFAAIPVVKGETEGTIQSYNKVLRKNRDLAESILVQLNIPFVSPRGSFYIFPNLKPIVGDKVREFCLATAKAENGIVVIPGVAFGAPDHIRISLATHEMEEGMRRLEKAIIDLKSKI